ncbi:protein kinase family protein [Streptomyces sp. NPDC058045]|uniref:protein kinase family protein n=1 Tax=Streptomyces sp. NPDC058045 TaxID=3346311 RepID=UPI0036ED6A2E
MAERSTAAVDVADTSGEESLTAEAGGATADGVDQTRDQSTADARTTEVEHTAAASSAAAPDSDSATGDDAPAGEPASSAVSASPVNGAGARAASAATRTPPELHSGHKLAGRYRLEECITRLDGFSSWRAVDEKLRRAVGVHLLAADHPRARSVLAAARASALLGDLRFVQVLDAVEENNLVYVVHEWLPDAVELTALLAAGPLEVHDAYQMVTQLSQAMAAAHREGLAHLQLTPSAVLRTSTGQWRIRGLAVSAALRGITSDAPQRTDTEAIGALLYATLTQRWPYEDDAYGLSGLPKDVGLIAPDQVRAGVHRGLSELAMRALVNDGATASRQDPPCTTPDDLVKAIAEMPRIRPAEPTFTAPPEYQRTTYQQGNYGRPGANAPVVPPVVPPPAPLQGRTGRILKWGVSALLIAALGLGSWQLATALMDRGKKPGDTGTSQTENGSDKNRPGAGKQLKIASAKEFAPNGPGVQEDQVPLAIDGKSETAWVTPHYKGFPNFGNLPSRKEGSGIIVDLGKVQDLSGVDVFLYRGGQKVEVLAAGESASAPAALSDFPHRLTPLSTAGQQLHKDLDKPVRTRYVLVHISSLPPDTTSGWYRGGISELKFRGTPS